METINYKIQEINCEKSDLYKIEGEKTIFFTCIERIENNSFIKPFHLYITSSSPIKKNELYIDDLTIRLLPDPVLKHSGEELGEGEIIQSTTGTTSPHSTSRKLVATTNLEYVGKEVLFIDEETVREFFNKGAKEMYISLAHNEKGVAKQELKNDFGNIVVLWDEEDKNKKAKEFLDEKFLFKDCEGDVLITEKNLIHLIQEYGDL